LKLSPRGPAPEAGRTFGSYRLIRELGRGGFGRVWEAESLETVRRLALKVITETQAASPEVLQRFEREGRLAASLNHPNCVYVFGAEEVDGYPVITMELMPGGTLQDLLRQRGRLPAKEAVDFILDVIEGLEAANNAGILHRDVKPSNCFLDENGKAKIGDFGLSKTLELDSNVTISGAFIGTPSYASPEQVRGREIDFRSDIYSVGATLYALLTGEPPFVAKRTGEVLARILSEEPTPFSRHRVDVPKGLQRVSEGQESASPDAFLTQLKDVVHRPAQVTRGMRAGPQLLIAIPILFLVAMALIAPLLIPASMEDLTKARWYVAVLRGIEREPDTKETRDRREAIRIILAASYAKVRASLQGRQIVKQLRWDLETERAVESALQDYPSSAASDVAAAREVIAGIRAWRFDASPRDSDLAAAREMIAPRQRFKAGFLTPHLVSITLALISIPAILCAVILRGGALLYLFGITVQTADGRPASRWRCLARALVAWFFFTLCALLPLIPGIPRLNLSLTSLPFSILPGAVALIAAIFSVANPERGIPDFIARTHLVPR